MTEFPEPTERKSKSQKKREMTALQELGERLVELKPEQIKRIGMPDELREAVLFARTMKKDEALRRQLQLIGSLMREIDPEPIQEAIEEIDSGSRFNVRAFQQVEAWRDELVRGDERAMDEVLAQFPGAEHQQLRQLVQNARREKETGKPRGAARALFRRLMALVEGK